MVKISCDKCGADMDTDSRTNVVLPVYKIFKYAGFPVHLQEINLCSDCQKLFEQWLNKENKE